MSRLSDAKRASRRRVTARAARVAARAGTVAAKRAGPYVETFEDVKAFLLDSIPKGIDFIAVEGEDVYELGARNVVRASAVTVLDLPGRPGDHSLCLTCGPLGVRVYGSHPDREAAVAQAGDRLGFAALLIRKWREKLERGPA